MHGPHIDVWRRVGWTLLVLYLAALTASSVLWALSTTELPAVREGTLTVTLPATGEAPPVRIAYQVFGPADAENPADLPVVVLIHGSPGRGENFTSAGRDPGMARALAQRYLVIVPDLPGFGDSTIDTAELSIAAHAAHLRGLLDALDVQQAHLVGYSMGGGPALLLWDQDPGRVASVTLLSSIGVQEMELLGDYTLNHAIHGLQLSALQAARILTPHFGNTELFDAAIAYARNFYETDQRPLRGILQRFEPPLLILHGERDFLVPVQAAHEHHRIAPHSELWVNNQSHFMVFEDRPALLEPLVSFIDRVESGMGRRLGEATPERIAQAAEPFDPSTIPAATGVFLAVLMALLALSTLVSEDLTCIGAGLMVASGRLSFVSASVACLAGIFIGDIMLFLAGRILGRPAVQRAPLKWFVSAAALERSRRWFDARGPVVILMSRFMPGMRLPTYVAAGVLGTSLLKFCLWFLLAGVLWTPALVGLSMVAGKEILDSFGWLQAHPWLGIGLVFAILLTLLKICIPMLSHRGRRLLYGRWLRLTQWEYWPTWVLYPPIVLYLLWLGLKHRSLTVVTAVNPCMPAGGIVGESKTAILDHIRACLEENPGEGTASQVLPASCSIPGDLSEAARIACVHSFMNKHALEYPLVLKPDAGQRGAGVEIVHSAGEIPDALERLPVDVTAQEFVAGIEFGIFYAREPDDMSGGDVFSITEKIFPTVTGDGTRTLEELLLDDARAPAMIHAYTANLGEHINDVPDNGKVVKLTEVGAHARGTIFRDARNLLTPQLEDAVDSISRRISGFYFGRYDIIVPSVEHLQRGENLRVIELNGLTSEATHIYDARTPLFGAWKTLASQWRRAFRIGMANRARGVETTSVPALIRMAFGFLKTAAKRTHSRP